MNLARKRPFTNQDKIPQRPIANYPAPHAGALLKPFPRRLHGAPHPPSDRKRPERAGHTGTTNPARECHFDVTNNQFDARRASFLGRFIVFTTTGAAWFSARDVPEADGVPELRATAQAKRMAQEQRASFDECDTLRPGFWRGAGFDP